MSVATRFNPAKGLIVVPARIRGPSSIDTAQLALDTGAMSTILSLKLLAEIGYDSVEAGHRALITTGSGVAYASVVQVRTLSALGVVRRSFRVLAHTLPPTPTIDGLLGLDFMRGHRLAVDFLRGRVSLT